jgi:uncharacterized protein with HEPN domain
MTERKISRVRDVKINILNTRLLLADRSFHGARDDVFLRATPERFLDIIGEASRHRSAEWKQRYGPEIGWPKIAAFGNMSATPNDSVDFAVLRAIYENDLGPLERVIDAMLAGEASPT